MLLPTWQHKFLPLLSENLRFLFNIRYLGRWADYMLQLFICLFMLHFFKTRSVVCSSTAASRDQVTSAVVNSGSTLRLCSLLRSVFRSDSPRFPLASPCPLLEDSQPCSLPGSSALWPGARWRRPLLRSRVSLSLICSTRTSPPRFVRLDSCQEAVTWREKRISFESHRAHLPFLLFTGKLWLVCVLWKRLPSPLSNSSWCIPLSRK